MFDTPEFWILIAAGLIAGLIDSIAGGGGLISLPTLTLLIGPGSFAIGTNKVAATAACFFALVVYARAGHVSLKGNLIFALVTGFGAVLGAFTSPLIPPNFYRWILILICPLMLWIVYRKDLWVREEIVSEQATERESRKAQLPVNFRKLWLLGLACGFYDGIAGPGAGTLMFLSLFLVARIPLLSAIATAKVSNLASGSLSLASYAWTGHVLWPKGTTLAVGISLGAVVGAKLASKHTAAVARVALLVLATLLLARLILS